MEENQVKVPEVAFGVKKEEDLSDAEKKQFGNMEIPERTLKGKHPIETSLNKTRKKHCQSSYYGRGNNITFGRKKLV